eukprot:GILI01005908.1.p1 GENE.GILI01005908.1~~GILI01005908.1.p1  ORF type:complete len:504 (+),score=14.24 GILI01005908.1:45-1556(+)
METAPASTVASEKYEATQAQTTSAPRQKSPVKAERKDRNSASSEEDSDYTVDDNGKNINYKFEVKPKKSKKSVSNIDVGEKSVSDVERLNEKLRSGKGDERDFPHLYIAHYRGFHYSPEHFIADERRVHRQAKRTGQDTYAPAVLQASGVRFIAENVEVGLAQVQKSFEELSIDKPYEAYWQHVGKEEKKHVCASPELARLMRICNSYDGYKNDVEKGKFGSLKVPSSPYVATADEPYSALRYAFGLYHHQFDSSSPVLLPQYKTRLVQGEHPREFTDDGRPKHFHIGKVIVIVHSLSEYLASEAHHIPSLGSLGMISPGAHSAWESETAFKALIPGKYIVIEEDVRVPALGAHNPEIHLRRYGLKSKYNIFDHRKGEILGKRAKTTKDQKIDQDEAERILMDAIASYQSLRLLRRAKEYVEEKGGTLVYQALPEPNADQIPGQIPRQYVRQYGIKPVDIDESKTRNIKWRDDQKNELEQASSPPQNKDSATDSGPPQQPYDN